MSRALVVLRRLGRRCRPHGWGAGVVAAGPAPLILAIWAESEWSVFTLVVSCLLWLVHAAGIHNDSSSAVAAALSGLVLIWAGVVDGEVGPEAIAVGVLVVAIVVTAGFVGADPPAANKAVWRRRIAFLWVDLATAVAVAALVANTFDRPVTSVVGAFVGLMGILGILAVLYAAGEVVIVSTRRDDIVIGEARARAKEAQRRSGSGAFSVLGGRRGRGDGHDEGAWIR